MSLISVIIIPAMEYHFVKDLGNRDALSGFWKAPLSNGAADKPFKAEKTFICIRIQNFFHIKDFALSLKKGKRLGITRKWPTVQIV